MPCVERRPARGARDVGTSGTVGGSVRSNNGKLISPCVTSWPQQSVLPHDPCPTVHLLGVKSIVSKSGHP